MKIPLETLGRIREAVDTAQFGRKSAVIERNAKALGIQPDTLRRKLRNTYGKKRRYHRASDPAITECARLVAAAKTQIEDASGYTVSTQTILDLLQSQEQISPAQFPSGRIPAVSTIDARIRRLMGGKKSVRHVRMETDRANHVWHTDASVSTALVAGPEPGTVMVLHARSRYKRPRNEKVWLTGVIDAASRLVSLRYHLAEGERPDLYIRHMKQLFKGGSQLYPFGGVPEQIVTDQGVFVKSAIGQTFCEGAGIDLRPNMPGNKRANGKIERTWRTLWGSMEALLALEAGKVMTLYEANMRLLDFELRIAERPHPVFPHKTRWQVWAESIEGRLRTVEGNWAVVPITRKVRPDGSITIERRLYEIPRDIDPGTEITVYMSPDGPHHWMHPDTDMAMPMHPYEAVEYGEYKGIPDGEAERVEKMAKAGVLQPVGAIEHAERVKPSTASHFTLSADYASPQEALDDLCRRVATKSGVPIPQEYRPNFLEVLKQNPTRATVERLAKSITEVQ